MASYIVSRVVCTRKDFVFLCFSLISVASVVLSVVLT